ncbi:hypothetical protein GCM10007424_08410 [Flavobacterium suaedae]|uniref:Peptidase S74 domain-containing protein n=2 Tax=Flavobacterium suaedae TaxID=1767027 RepID=A0ABQ1JKG8_9FLAO|nr:hypothetical protein GCM10007424_08410 [Flavobacterium suaedae]
MVSFSQNSSQGAVSTTIPTSSLGTQEIFRFKPGIITQLQNGTDFSFDATARWLSLGELVTPPSGQRLHGLRIQDEGKALVMGYSSAETNAFIQYISPNAVGRGLDIKFADSFTSTQSTLAASFRSNGSTDFGFADSFSIRKELYQVGIRSRFYKGLLITKGDSQISPANFTAADFKGPIIATSATFTSDEQFKQDIEAEGSVLELIKALNPVTYTFKTDNKFDISFPDAVQHGFIAQELEKLLPELVVNHNEEGVGTYKSVNYNGIISVLTKGIQELSEEVEYLKKQLADAKTYVVSKDNFTATEMDKIAESGFYLGQNTPNPFDNSTEIAYSFPKGAQNVVLMVFNLSGESLKEFTLKEEKGTVTLDASEFKPGLYLYSLISNNSEIITKKMLIK